MLISFLRLLFQSGVYRIHRDDVNLNDSAVRFASQMRIKKKTDASVVYWKSFLVDTVTQNQHIYNVEPSSSAQILTACPIASCCKFELDSRCSVHSEVQ